MVKFPVMSLRAILHVVLFASVGNLTLGANKLACEVRANPTADMPAHHHQHDGANGEEDSNAAAPGACCEAMTSCAVSLALATSTEPASISLHPAARPLSVDAELLSRLVPPDPPPPKV